MPWACDLEMSPRTTHLLYLHGFRSSPQSFKARRLHEWLTRRQPEVHWWCPQLPPSPRRAFELIESGITGWRALVMNPAVDPARDLQRHVGQQSLFHDPSQQFDFRVEYIDELRKLAVPRITLPERYAAIIAKGDELLDWREMTRRYAAATIRLLEGSDHGLSDFDEHLPFVLAFLGLAIESA